MKDTARSASMLQEMGFDCASFLLTQHTLIKGRKKWRPKRCNTLERIDVILFFPRSKILLSTMLSDVVYADGIIDKAFQSMLSFDQSLEETFVNLDSNGSGSLERDDVQTFLISKGFVKGAENETVQNAVMAYLGLNRGALSVNFDSFKYAFERRSRHQYLDEAFRMNSTFHRIFSKVIDASEADVNELSKTNILQALKSNIDTVAERIYQNIQKLMDLPSAEEVNLKYSMAAGEEGRMSYGTSDVYEGGLDAYIGLPSIKIVWAVVQEHCNSGTLSLSSRSKTGKKLLHMLSLSL